MVYITLMKLNAFLIWNFVNSDEMSVPMTLCHAVVSHQMVDSYFHKFSQTFTTFILKCVFLAVFSCVICVRVCDQRVIKCL